MKRPLFRNAWVAIALLATAGLLACGNAPLSSVTSPSSTAPSSSLPATGQVVLAEMFTGDWCGYCPPAAQAIEKLAKELGPEKLLVLEYHSGDKSATPETEARAVEYRIRAYPTIIFNGSRSVVGSASMSNSYQRYVAVINTELAKAPPVTVKATMTASGTQVSLDINVGNSGISGITDAELIAVVYEDTGTEEHHYIVRDMLRSSISSIAPDEQQTFNLSADFPGGISRLKAVAFVQLPSHLVLQSTLAAAP
jgi:thiol-disulfide isomerase/thioredoxin